MTDEIDILSNRVGCAGCTASVPSAEEAHASGWVFALWEWWCPEHGAGLEDDYAAAYGKAAG